MFQEVSGWSTLRTIAVTLGTILLIGILLFVLTGIWTPFVAVSSGSMQPNINAGDMVVVTEPNQFDNTGRKGVMTVARANATTPTQFNAKGDVIVFTPRGGTLPPDTDVIHRAHFWVDAGENWVDDTRGTPTNAANLPADATCTSIPTCPSPHAGFITKGDSNTYYDQAVNVTDPVKPEWVHAEAWFLLPYFGYIRLLIAPLAAVITCGWFLVQLYKPLFRLFIPGSSAEQPRDDSD